MSLALTALLVLVAILILAAFRSDLNAGILAVAAAYGLGLGAVGLSANEVAAFLPSQLIMTIVGVALLFELANQNGTLERLTAFALVLVRGHRRVLPLSFFVLSFLLSALGPGNIAATALVAPIAMRTSVSASISPLLMAILVCTGANAGAFSPVSVTGIINTTLIRQIGLTAPTLPLRIFLIVAALQAITALGAYVLFGGHKIKDSESQLYTAAPKPSWQHIVTLITLVMFIVSIVFLNIPASAAAFALAACLTLFRVADAEESIRHLPWAVVLLISGITIMLELLQTTGSLELATDLLAGYASPQILNGLLAFVSGLTSLGSSSSGVVMPLFIPLAPDILQKLGSGDLTQAVIAIDVGSHMVDVSPLSTLGALCLAALPEGADRSKLFRQLLLWGLSMTFVATLLAFLFLDLLQ
jgi:Na+/H+ antiporter NhaD/arsenite permease-like protein